MQTTTLFVRNRAGRDVLALLFVLAWQGAVLGVNGTWTNGAGGDYDSPGNWAGNTIGDGATFTADFSTLDIAGDINVTKDTALTIGHLKFGDTNTGTGGSWLLSSNAAALITLNNGVAAPTITVNPLLPATIQDDANISMGIGSALGFNKLGGGILTLSGANPDLHGMVSVNAGTLRVASTATFDYETATDPERTQFHLANGTTVEAATNVGDVAATGAGVSIATGGTVTLRVLNTAAVSFANVGGTGPGVTANLEATAGTFRLDQDWASGNALATVNMKGLPGTPSSFQLRVVGATFNQGSFANTNVNLTNATLQTVSNSTGNTIPLGSFSGDATSSLLGATNGGAVMYSVGGLNTDTTFAGATTTGTGLSLNKVGTGKLTLSGALAHTSTTSLLPDLRGGITRITSGTLAVTGTTVIPGGINDVTLGDLLTTIDVKAGATFDVSGASPTYETQALQQLIGSGTIVGNYNHSQGRLRPGDVPFGNENTAISASGSLSFTNNLNVSGGTINFDITTVIGDYNSNNVVDAADYVVWRENNGTGNPLANRDPANSGNVGQADYNSWRVNFGSSREVINVNGGNLSGNTVIDVGILPGAVAGTYTIINSTTPLTGSIASWTVNWTGRGATPTLTQTANQVQLNAGSLVPPAILNWRGDVSNIWDAGVGGTPNWRNTSTNASDNFFTRDTVRFLDTYDNVNPPATTTVTLNQIVSPGAVIVNTSLNYTISGTGRISGSSTFLKQGTGRLSLPTSNDFSGGSTISGGAVDLEQAGRLGSRAITLNGGELHAGTTSLFPLNNDLVIVGTGNVLATDMTAGQTLEARGRISGTGNLVLKNDMVAAGGTLATRGIDFFGDNSAFTGSITFSDPGIPATEGAVFFRFRNAFSQGTNVAWDLRNNGSTLSQRVDVDAPTTFVLGSLTGGPMSGVSGFGSGADPGHQSIWQIGSLNTSTEFAGVIANGNVGDDPDKLSAVTKVGTGTLTLSGVNTYTGDTRVQGGILRTTNATVLGDLTALFLSAGTTVNLDFDYLTLGNDTIRGLVIPSTTQQIGTWGRIGHPTAQFTSAFLTGNGLLDVTAIITPGASVNIGVVPEPASGSLLIFVAGLLTMRRSRRRG